MICLSDLGDQNGCDRSFDIPGPVIRDGSLWLKGLGRFRLPSVPEAKVLQVRVVKPALRPVQPVVEREDQSGAPIGEPVGIDMGNPNWAIMSNGGMVPAVTFGGHPLKRTRRAVSRAKKISKSRRKKVKTLAREWERTRI